MVGTLAMAFWKALSFMALKLCKPARISSLFLMLTPKPMARFFISPICSSSVLGRVKLSRTTLAFFSLAGLTKGLAVAVLLGAVGLVAGLALVLGLALAVTLRVTLVAALAVALPVGLASGFTSAFTAGLVAALATGLALGFLPRAVVLADGLAVFLLAGLAGLRAFLTGAAAVVTEAGAEA